MAKKYILWAERHNGEREDVYCKSGKIPRVGETIELGYSYTPNLNCNSTSSVVVGNITYQMRVRPILTKVLQLLGKNKHRTATKLEHILVEGKFT